MEKRIIDKMISAMKIDKDEKVLINFWGTKEELKDLEDFEEGFAGQNIKVITLRFTDEDIIELMDKYPEGLPDSWFDAISDAKVVVDIMNKPIGLPPEGIEKERMPQFGRILSQMFGFVSKFHKFIQITMPTETNARMLEVPFEEYYERMLAAFDIDYEKLQEECEQKIKELSSPKRIIKTGKDCVLEMDITDRKWYIDAGDGSLPCGEIYIAPVEENTNGTIYFEKLNVDGGEVYKDVVLTVRDGRLVDSNCKEFLAFMNSIEEENANIVSELGIGMNPNVVNGSCTSALDETALGTFHIAFGMNHMFGGKNDCRFHMDFVTTGIIE